MNVYAGLDVSLNETSVCMVDAEGAVVRECKVPSEPDAVDQALRGYVGELRHVGIEASSLGGWLQMELSTRGFDAIVIESRHTHSLSTMRNKTDRNDARGIAQLMRLGWFKAVHVKSQDALRLRMLLGCRKLVVRKLIDVENDIRGTLRAFGLKVGSISRGRFAAPLSPWPNKLIRSFRNSRCVCWQFAPRFSWSTDGCTKWWSRRLLRTRSAVGS